MLNDWRYCDKKAPIETTWEPSVIVTSQLLAAYFKMISAVKCGFISVNSLRPSDAYMRQ